MHVCSKDFAPEYEIQKHAQKQRGLFSVQGQPIQRYGQKTVCVDPGSKISSSSTCEVTDSRKEILAAAPIVDKGIRVVLDDERSYMLNKATGKVKTLRRHGSSWMVDVRVKTPKLACGLEGQVGRDDSSRRRVGSNSYLS